MIVESVLIDSIYADPANIRRHSERNIAAIKASLARHVAGLIRPDFLLQAAE